MCACLAAQYLCTRVWALPRFDPLSAGISGLSLCLLLRTDRPELVLVAALVTIASKFVCRVDGRHLFNPTNFGLVVMLAATGDVWVSPGQWGSLAFAACWSWAAPSGLATRSPSPGCISRAGACCSLRFS